MWSALASVRHLHFQQRAQYSSMSLLRAEFGSPYIAISISSAQDYVHSVPS